MSRLRTRSLRRLAVLILIPTLGWGAYQGFRNWRYEEELGRAEVEVAARHYAQARSRLLPLARAWPGRDEVEYPLGICEAALGHVDPALAAWARVPADSVIAPRADLERARLALAHGRLAIAEESLKRIVERSDAIGAQAAQLAQQLDLFSGRAYRIPKRIERQWRAAYGPPSLLRTHWLHETQAFPLQEVSEALERLGREAPDDDRLWLGRADLAVRSGRFDEADRLLADCEQRRPDDPDVRRARLAWALDARRPDAVEAALAKVPADLDSPAELAAITARVAELRGDPKARREALERLVTLDPGDPAAWDALAELHAADPGSGQGGAREEARRRKAEIDRASDLYRHLMGEFARGERSRLVDLARTAESLGRRFEAYGWWWARVREAPNDSEARAALARVRLPDLNLRPDPALAGRTLADLLPRPSAPTRTVLGTAGVEPVPTFRDLAESSGLRFIYDHDPTPLRRLPETMGGGLGLLDYDGDGWLDVYCVQGGRFPDGAESGPTTGDRLFRNRGNGTFEDVTERAGIAAFSRGYGHGVAVGDVDNDGHPDLFVTRWRSFALYRNRCDGTFEDVTERYGLGGERGWPTSAAFADLDLDGDLDLYVCQYLSWDPRTSAPCPNPDRPGQNLYCVPRAFPSEPDRLFRNDGGRFVDVSESAGIAAADRDGRGLGVVVADLDADGKPDLFVANDMTANFLFRNLGGMKFEEVGGSSGAGSNAGGGYQAGMGIACGDLDGDGKPDLVVTNFYGESVTFYANLGRGFFADRTAAVGLAAPTRFVLGFGAAFLDANNDGKLDLALANGHVNDFRPAIPHAMSAQLFLGAGGGRMIDASTRSGSCWSELRVGRGLAVGDLDNDGRVDVLILSQGGPLAYFRNEGPAGPFLTLALRGTTSHRDAVGAVVRVTGSGSSQAAWRLGGGSFLSASDPRFHFGIPPGPVDVEVRWPGGRIDSYRDLGGNAAYELIEADPVPRSLRGWLGRSDRP